MRSVTAVFPAVLALLVLDCSSTSSTPASSPCSPGEKDPCIGPGDCAGIRTCRDDSKWEACACTGGTGGLGGGSGSGGQPTGGAAGDDAGPTTCAGKCGTAGCGTCPKPKTVLAAGFDIDANEVTNAQYAAFLEVGYVSTSVPECNANVLQPIIWAPDAGADNRPVAHVDWCDAWAYCEWAGRRLCGKIGGGSNDFAEYKNPAASQWYEACSKGGTQNFPYGATYDDAACNIGGTGTLDVGTTATCQGGYPGLYDMSGNVWEWEDSCSGNLCRLRGGGFKLTSGECDANVADKVRTYTEVDVGFRCCSLSG